MMRIKPTYYILLAIIICTLLFVVFFTRASHVKPTEIITPTTIELLDSELVTITPQTLARSLPFIGNLKAVHQATIRSKLAGDIREIFVREGASVKAGQILARMDNIEAQAYVDQNTAKLEIAQRDYDNNKRLFDRGFISSTAFESSVSNLKAAQAAVSLTNKSMRDTIIRSPIRGQIAERMIQIGEKVTVDQKLFTVIDPSQLEIEAHIPVEQINQIRVGQAVQLFDDNAKIKSVGKVARISPATTTDSRSVAVYIDIAQSNMVRAGMFVEGQIILEQRDNALIIPASALTKNNQATTRVMLLQTTPQGYTLKPQEVSLGMRNNDNRDAKIEVLHGLHVGDRILVHALDNLPPPHAQIKISNNQSVATTSKATSR